MVGIHEAEVAAKKAGPLNLSCFVFPHCKPTSSLIDFQIMLQRQAARLMLLKAIKLAAAKAGDRTTHLVIPAGKWTYYEIDDLDLTTPVLDEYKANFDANVRGLADDAGNPQIPLDIEHNANEEGAPGWVRSMEVRAEGMYWEIEWTDLGIELVSNKRYQYLSPTLYEHWVHPLTKIRFDKVIVSAALTNQPFLAGQPALELSANTKQGRFLLSLVDVPKKTLKEVVDMTIEELQTVLRAELPGLVKPVVIELLAPLTTSVTELSAQSVKHQTFLDQQAQAQAQRENAAAVETTKALILSWRFNNGQSQIAPAHAELSAKAATRLSEADRAEYLNALKLNPPQLVPLSTMAISGGTQSQGSKLTDSHREIARQMGQQEEDLEKYLQEVAA